MTTDALAFDRGSVRTYSKDGHLHVKVANISKANICPYLGREIPNFQALGLDPDKVYQILRDPDELKKAAPSFNNLPILSEHVHVTAERHKPELVIGSTGSDAAFTAPYLHNSLSFWAGVAIDDIESEIKKELSSSYHYRADMTSGTYLGAPYDGVMRDITGNHVALVENGRAGDDVVVGDSAASVIGKGEAEVSTAAASTATPNRSFQMAKAILSRKAVLVQGACIAALTPKLAQDANIDLTAVLESVTAKNFKAKKPTIMAALTTATTGKLAQDADLEDVMELLDALDDVAPAETDPAPAAVPVVEAKPADDEDPMEAVRALLKAKGLSEKDVEEVVKTMAAKPEESSPVAASDDTPDMTDMVTKGAMDAAMKSVAKSATEAAIKVQSEIRDAERAVRPYIGDLAIAHDSAEGVYRTALKALNVDVEGIHPSALPAILKMQPAPGSKKAAPTVAMDAASAKGFAERFPQAAHIRTL